MPITLGVLAVGAAAPVAPSYFIGQADNNDTNFYFYDVKTYGTNIYIAGIDFTTNFQGFLAKLNANGELQWQREIGDATDNQVIRAVDVDSAGNVYIAGNYESSSRKHSWLVKYDSNGNLQAQRGINPGTYDFTINDIVIDSSDRVYLCGYTSENGTDGFVCRYTSSLTLDWQARIGTAQQDYFEAITINSDNELLVTGMTTSGDVDGQLIVLKLDNSNGNITWQRQLAGTLYEAGYDVITLPTSNKVIVVGKTQSTTTYGALVAAWTNAGTFLWDLIINDTTSDIFGAVPDTDPSSTYFWATGDNGTNEVGIWKFDTDGVLQWERGLDTNVSSESQAIDRDSNGDLVVVGNLSSTLYSTVFAKLPDDGSLTGTYAVPSARTWTYTSRTIGTATISLTASTPSLTKVTSTYATAVPSFTESTSTASWSNIQI